MGNLKRALDKCFPFGERLSEGYNALQINMFSYEYIHKMQMISGVKKTSMLSIKQQNFGMD